MFVNTTTPPHHAAVYQGYIVYILPNLSPSVSLSLFPFSRQPSTEGSTSCTSCHSVAIHHAVSTSSQKKLQSSTLHWAPNLRTDQKAVQKLVLPPREPRYQSHKDPFPGELLPPLDTLFNGKAFPEISILK